jgi:BirA family biotin operon repressor/biotin-[acetyl-CoA-carboxylase] ligase
MAAESFLHEDQLRGCTFIRRVEIHRTLRSTNDRAAELARELSADQLPALVVARRQTAGRGRGKNAWWSADGGLTLSLLLDPKEFGIQPANWPQLSLTTAVAVCDAVSPCLETNPQSAIPNSQSTIGIKWPNDVLIDGRKVCGILIESPGGAAPAKDRLIIGIGVNVNNSWCQAPEAAGENGVALCDLIGSPLDLTTILSAVLSEIATRIDQLRTRDAKLVRAWQQRNLLRGKRVVVDVDGRTMAGQCREIAADGAIVIDTAFGPQPFYNGSVRLCS